MAFDTYTERLFLPDTSAAPKLHSNLNNNQFLDAISAPSSGIGGKKKITPRRGADDLIDISDDSEEEDGGEQQPVH